MADEEHLRILREGVEAWNRWREEHSEVRPDLKRADLREADLNRGNLTRADLREANLSRADLVVADLIVADLREADLNGATLMKADLREADLRKADLRGADLGWADLSGTKLGRANLNGADLTEANFNGADLSGADLREAYLEGAYLSGAVLDGVDFSRANVGQTMFGDVDLSAVKGLESVVHRGPSTIGIDTVVRSRGRIPEVFLRGAGVPDAFITYIGSLVGRAIEYYSCFISYSSRDQAFAERLHADLQAKGVRCWFAPEDIQSGRKIYEQIEEAIRYHDKLLLVLSENSMASEWVKTEIRRARREEAKAGRRKLFPITLAPFSAVRDWEAFDADIGKDMAVEVREYFIPDFSAWKEHDAYREAFERLVRDLKAEGGRMKDEAAIED